MESEPLISLPSIFPAYTFSNLAFGCPSFLSFFPSESNPSLPSQRFSPATSPYGSSFWVPRSTSLLFTSYCFPSSLVFYYIAERLRRTYLSFASCAFWFPFQAVSIPLWLCCASQGSWAFGSLWDPSPVLSTRLFLVLSSWQARPFFLSSLCFMGSETCPFMDLGLQIF